MKPAGEITTTTRTARRVEWPTIVVAGAIAAGFAALLTAGQRLPAVVSVALLGALSAWYGSLRHEVVHGHPTPSSRLNTVLVAVPLGLTEPFWRYRDDHLRHHRCDDLTDPEQDPESQYLSDSDWRRAGPIVRLARVVNTTLAGRMIVGPWFVATSVVRDLVRRWRRGQRRWSIARFVVADLVVLLTVAALGFPVWQYLVGVVYVGTSLTLVRSYAEHRAVPTGSRTAVVHGRGFWALLFLNNNLHVTHHRRPDLAWYELPAAHAVSSDDAVAANGAGLYRGYAEIFRRFLVRPAGPPVDPLDRSRTVA